MNALDSSRVLKSLGLVFGDIGTSPIYTMGVILLMILPTEDNILGVLSLIFWSLILVISIQYVWLAMNLGFKGEGGTIVLKGILISLLKKGPLVPVVSFLAIIGVCLFMGDGVITPAISILSAVEGIRLVPGLEGISEFVLLCIAAIIAISLFFIQQKGTERVAWAFGPVMFIWFSMLAITGIISIVGTPQVLFSLSPHYALSFLLNNGLTAFFILSAVILCITGGEALYADMGHLGREPIVKGWYFVFPALMLSYLGQGAYVIQHGSMSTVLFNMVSDQLGTLYIPFLLLSVVATIIASQAMISGMFSIVYQAMTTRILPKLKIDFTSSELHSQIYIDAVNWALMAAVLIVMGMFGSSEHLAAAYGLAVAGDMTISAMMLLLIFLIMRDPLKSLISCVLICVDLSFFLASLTKLPHGGYWSFLLALVPFTIIIIFISGQEKLRVKLKPIPMKEFIPAYKELYMSRCKISGTALYFTSDIHQISPYIGQIFFKNEIIYKHNILVSIRMKDYPFGVKVTYLEDCAPGLSGLLIETGYMEILDIEALIRERGIEEKTIFYGMENIISDRMVWKIFGIMKKAAPPFVQFYSLPPEKIHGVITRIIM
ncbi:KUP/HAK/KT family potassium transporter [uncultured Methanospirillum sp.]|uniref:KUP/HAK/KT family potassium transporter n=1 Tax=uncultured Methanospirillum sp. TaxID=262503 RepID=UPI0029C6406D|nr:KUP/HAK/KT family potassium transporter [uncultured Methanospirillum sp.]